MTVITDPSIGPHLLGSTVNLTCLVHPQRFGVTYRWRSYVQYTTPFAANSSLPYSTLTIGIGHPHTARYHCQVYYRGQLLATGNTVITVKGGLHHYDKESRCEARLHGSTKYVMVIYFIASYMLKIHAIIAYLFNQLAPVGCQHSVYSWLLVAVI